MYNIQLEVSILPAMSIFNIFLPTQPVFYRRRERVVRAGEKNEKIFFIKQGLVRQYLISEKGNELTMHVFTPQSIFPISYSGNENAQYYYECLTPAEVYSIDFAEFIRRTQKNKGFLLEIIRQFEFYASSIRTKLEVKTLGDAHQQVVFTLIKLAQQLGEKNKDKVVIPHWFTHQDLAIISGLSRERVTIELQKLIQNKRFSYRSHFIVIEDLQLLEEILNR